MYDGGMTTSDVRRRLQADPDSYYEPHRLAAAMLAMLEQMEAASDARPACDRYRRRTGLVCAPEFRGCSDHGDVENAITGWLADLLPNAHAQVPDLAPGVRPDIVFSYARDRRGEDVLVILEAKPVWKRWITSGEQEYRDTEVDEYGRCTGGYAMKNIGQVVQDRDKLLRTYTDPRDRLMLLALVFQRPGELDDKIVDAVGPGWEHHKRHIIDQCNPPGDDIGVTGMVFWPA
jgi:hypothetical protein